MILQVLFYAELQTFVLKCKFNSKSLAPPLKISSCAIGSAHSKNNARRLTQQRVDGVTASIKLFKIDGATKSRRRQLMVSNWLCKSTWPVLFYMCAFCDCFTRDVLPKLRKVLFIASYRGRKFEFCALRLAFVNT